MIQNGELRKVRDGHVPVSMTMLTGDTFEGHITDYDQFTLRFRSELGGRKLIRLIFKHSVASITYEEA